MQKVLSVLISGAGIAGTTLANLLARRGHHVTVVECDQGVRSSGNPVDVRGAAYDVLAQLGLTPRLREAATRVTRLVVVDDDGRAIVATRSQRRDRRDLEIPRAALSAILLEACPVGVERVFGDEVTHLRASGRQTEVTFAHLEPRRVDLVVGADGLHSRVRSLAWGPEDGYTGRLGMYVATVRTAGPADREDEVLIHNEPGRATVLHPAAGTAIAAFLFRSDAVVDPRDRSAAQALLTRTYRSAGWRSRELLDVYGAADDVYFDAVTRVRVPTWSRGDVVLLGDAASCVSLFGEGSSSAIIGAATLADALDAHPGDVRAALRSYETRHRDVVASRQRRVGLTSHLLVPATHLGLRACDAALRVAQLLPS